jgi:DNA-nicking Smr family endonuclease
MVTEDERRQFREAMRGVRRLHIGESPTSASRPRQRPSARFTRAERLAVLADSLMDLRSPQAPLLETGEELLYRGPRIGDDVFRQLRRGRFRVEAELDLHGLRVDEARLELRAFLAAALAEGLRVVRIVHGKGLRSGNRGPVLRQMTGDVLRQLDAVLAFASAREVDGGSGACLVLLQRPGHRRQSPHTRD